jgi:hypothetical protein
VKVRISNTFSVSVRPSTLGPRSVIP